MPHMLTSGRYHLSENHTHAHTDRDHTHTSMLNIDVGTVNIIMWCGYEGQFPAGYKVLLYG